MIKYTFKINSYSDGLSIKEYLKKNNISNEVIKSLAKELGLILINNEPKFTIAKLKKNDILTLHIKESEKNNIVPTKNTFEIFYEDEYFLVIKKQRNIATIPSFSNYENSLANFVTYYMQKEPNFIFRAINRLDKEAEGFVVIAKDKLIYSLLKNNIQKYYTAICFGNLKKQIITSKIKTLNLSNGKNEIKREISNTGKESFTEIISTKYNIKRNTTTAKIFIKTGRTHQIRLHLSSIGHPIIGDKLYNQQQDDTSLQLYCNEIYIWHPIKHKTIHLIYNI